MKIGGKSKSVPKKLGKQSKPAPAPVGSPMQVDEQKVVEAPKDPAPVQKPENAGKQIAKKAAMTALL